MKWLIAIKNFVGIDRQRFVWEIAIAVLVWGVGYGLSWFMNRQTLQTCQDERTVLLRQNANAQALIDSVRWAGRMAQKDLIISQKEQQYHDLREKMARDSVQHLSDLDAIRAINNYLHTKRPTPNGRGRQREPG